MVGSLGCCVLVLIGLCCGWFEDLFLSMVFGELDGIICIVCVVLVIMVFLFVLEFLLSFWFLSLLLERSVSFGMVVGFSGCFCLLVLIWFCCCVWWLLVLSCGFWWDCRWCLGSCCVLWSKVGLWNFGLLVCCGRFCCWFLVCVVGSCCWLGCRDFRCVWGVCCWRCCVFWWCRLFVGGF